MSVSGSNTGARGLCFVIRCVVPRRALHIDAHVEALAPLKRQANPRRADDVLVEYATPLFASRRTPTTKILHVHESNPFEAYRQLLKAMQRYKA
jgi:hypothetical protein